MRLNVADFEGSADPIQAALDAAIDGDAVYIPALKIYQTNSNRRLMPTLPPTSASHEIGAARGSYEAGSVRVTPKSGFATSGRC